MHQPIARVPGFQDLSASEQRRRESAERVLLETFRLHGFAAIDVPVVEYLDLYLRKNGAQVLNSLYSFQDSGKREVALRPEFTASVLRAQAVAMGQTTEPVRVAYAGPVFQYQDQVDGEPRQFTQAGVELLGVAGSHADAEILALACEAARKLGVQQPLLVVGHLGPLRTLLGHLQVDAYAEGYLLEHLEFFNRGLDQQQAVRRRLGLVADENGAEDATILSDSLATAISAAPLADAHSLVSAVLEQMGLSLAGSTRTPEEIIDRVLSKARLHSMVSGGSRNERLERALAFTESLGRLRGEPQVVLPQAERLLQAYDVPQEALDELRGVLQRLGNHHLEGVRLELAPGMARGIAYYSGMIFELFAGEPGDGRPICGGGRYDSLGTALTGRRHLPALGFAFSVEAALQAIPAGLPPLDREPRVAICTQDGAGAGAAQQLASALRAHGVVAVVCEPTDLGRPVVESATRSGYAALVTLPDGNLEMLERREGVDRLLALLQDLMAGLPDGPGMGQIRDE